MDSPIGATLERWLQRLDAAGFRVGVRERLVVQQLLVQQAAQGLLAEPLPQLLGRLAPLLCTSAAQQQQYQRLLAQFVAEAVPAQPARQAPWWLNLLALALVGALLVWLVELDVDMGTAPRAASAPAAASAPSAASAPRAGAPKPDAAAQAYVAVGNLPLEPSVTLPTPWAGPLRWALRGLWLALLLAAAALLWRRSRAQARLAQVRTDAAVDVHLLRTAAATELTPHPALARSVAAGLRQRVAGETQVLDVKATLQATLRAAGALRPRYRALKRTPEYLVLIDSRHGLDHVSHHALALVRALADAGVSLSLWHYEATPQDGLWPHRAAQANGAAQASHSLRTPFADLATRHSGHRLLVFGGCDALGRFTGAAAQDWAAHLALLGQRAWFTPLPLHAWAGAETLVEQQGFLLLPAQAQTLPTLASWLGSEQLSLSVAADWPLAYPELLAGDALDWVARQEPPPAQALAELCAQLQVCLGLPRWHWLCACAVFPALSPALTLALGRCVLGADERGLALGYTALAALPWFRHGHMPLWLRQHLAAALGTELQQRVRAELRRLMDETSRLSQGDVLAEVATLRDAAAPQARSQRLQRDVLLAQFMQPGSAIDPLTQPLDASLRRRLGLGLKQLAGLPRWLWPPLLAATLLALATVTPWWPQFQRTLPRAPLQLAGDTINAGAQRQAGTALAFGPDGSELVGRLPGPLRPGVQQAQADAQVWDVRTGATRGMSLLTQAPHTQTSDWNPQRSVRAEIGADGLLQLLDAQGQAIGLPLNRGDDAMASVAFSPDGKRLGVRSRDGSIRIWGEPYGLRVELVGCQRDAALSPMALQLAQQLQDSARNEPIGKGARTPVDWAVYTASAWSRLRARTALPAGLILHGPGVERQAQTLQTLLRGAPDTQGTTWNLQADAALQDTVAVGLCLRAGTTVEPPQPELMAIEGLSPKQVLELQVRVTSMFSADAKARVAATEALIKDWSVFSDAVAVALQQAWGFQRSGVVAGSPEMDGIYNTLVLAATAMPATLNREADVLSRLAEAASANGDKTREMARKVLTTLNAGKNRRPLVYVQYSGPGQQAQARQVQAALRSAGWDAPGIEDVGAKQPQRTELRVQGLSDRRVARQIDALVEKTLGHAVRLASIPERATRRLPTDTYELWLGADLVPGQANNPSQAPAAQTQDDANLVRIEVCRPLIRANVAAQVDALAGQAEAIVRRKGFQTERVDVTVQAAEFTLNGVGGLTLDYPFGDAKAQEIVIALSGFEFQQLGFRVRGLNSAAPRMASRVSVRVCSNGQAEAKKAAAK